ncbi:cyclin-G-associated kinase [Planoprotostelium fungivorum]|uniref:Cyclin-G-associated kinase n=1 Tax=Planoprotostelium fungivorum TaxID=1890364 RepID=A0A2P6N248_9EUKA|nr:cyclin-G-associated kinase [Planoprotostelium fungivorum]
MRKLRASFGSPKTSRRNSLSSLQQEGTTFTQDELGRYSGQMNNGKKHGLGKLTWTAGDWYDGEWFQDMKQGKGTMSWSNGDVYTGGWIEDYRHGDECMTKYANGGIYEGPFHDDLRAGRGKFIWPGLWETGGRTGPGVLITAEGRREEQFWSEGRANYSIALPAKRPTELQYVENKKKEENAFFDTEDIPDPSLLRSPLPHHNITGPIKTTPPRVAEEIIQPISSPPVSRSPRTSRRISNNFGSPSSLRSSGSNFNAPPALTHSSGNPFLVKEDTDRLRRRGTSLPNMASLLKGLSRVAEKAQAQVFGSQEGVRNDGPSDDPLNMLVNNFNNLGSFISSLQSSVKQTASSLKASNAAYRDFAGAINQSVTGNLNESFDIQQLTQSFCQYQGSIQSAAEKEYISTLNATFVTVLNKEKEVDNEVKRIVDDRKKLASEYEMARRNAPQDAATAKQRYDRYTEKATDHLAKKNEERAVIIAKCIASLMQCQSRYHKALLEAVPSHYDEDLNTVLRQLTSRRPGDVKNASPPVTPNKPQPTVTTQATPQQAPAVPPKPVQPAPVAAPAPPPASEPAPSLLPNLIDSFDSPAAVPHAQPAPPTSSDVLFSFDMSPAMGKPTPAAPPAAASTGMDDIFASFTSPAPSNSASPMTPHAVNASAPAQQQPASVFDSFASFKPSSGAAAGPFGDLYSFSANAAAAPVMSPTTAHVAPTSNSSTVSSPGEHPSWDNSNEDRTKSAPVQRKPMPKLAPTDNLAAYKDAQKTADDENAQRRDIEDDLDAKIAAWTAGKKDNIRALLASMHTALWEGATWNPVSIGDLLQPNKLKISFRRAQLVVHEDKMTGKPLEQRLLAAKIFYTLSEAAKNEPTLQ